MWSSCGWSSWRPSHMTWSCRHAQILAVIVLQCQHASTLCVLGWLRLLYLIILDSLTDPAALCLQVLAGYPAAEVTWLQEEPENMGAWRFVKTRLDTAMRELLPSRPRSLHYIGRPAAASPGVRCMTAALRVAVGQWSVAWFSLHGSTISAHCDLCQVARQAANTYIVLQLQRR